MEIKQLLGEYDVKVDAKGRFRLPSGLLQQLEEWAERKFIVNRGFEKCLVLYPEEIWNGITAEINQLNLYNRKNREFVRYFYRGATELNLDSAERMLLPKRLADYAGIEKDVTLMAYNGRIEIWSREEYDLMLEEEPMDFSDLAQDVLGKLDQQQPEVE